MNAHIEFCVFLPARPRVHQVVVDFAGIFGGEYEGVEGALGSSIVQGVGTSVPDGAGGAQ